MRHLVAVEMPDVAVLPAAPPTSLMSLVALSGRPKAIASNGDVYDLANIVRSAYINGAEQLAARVEGRTVTTNGSGEATVTFAVPYSVAPNVSVQAFTSSGTQVTIAEVVSVTTTAVEIRTYRTRTQGVLLGGTIYPTERVSAFCHLTILGIP